MEQGREEEWLKKKSDRENKQKIVRGDEEAETATLHSQETEQEDKLESTDGRENEGCLHLWPLFRWQMDRKTDQSSGNVNVSMRATAGAKSKCL